MLQYSGFVYRGQSSGGGIADVLVETVISSRDCSYQLMLCGDDDNEVRLDLHSCVCFNILAFNTGCSRAPADPPRPRDRATPVPNSGPRGPRRKKVAPPPNSASGERRKLPSRGWQIIAVNACQFVAVYPTMLNHIRMGKLGGWRPRGHHECVRCLLYTSPSPRDQRGSRMPSSA